MWPPRTSARPSAQAGELFGDERRHEPLRVEPAFEAVVEKALLVVFVVRIGERFEQRLVSRLAVASLGWRGAFAAETTRCHGHCGDVLHSDPEAPALALVAEPMARAGRDLAEGRFIWRAFAGAELAVAGPEAVIGAGLPVEGDGEDPVQPGEGDVGAHLQPPPDDRVQFVHPDRD